MRSMILIAALAAFALPAFSHSATEYDEPTAVKVSYKDLDLSNPKDAKTLLERIRAAALEACGVSSFSVPGYKEAMQRSQCYNSGVASALENINRRKAK